VMPIIPLLTDSKINLQSIFSQAGDCGVDYLLPGTLYLRGKTRTAFFEFVEKEYPEILNSMQMIYKTGAAGKDYKNQLYQFINTLREKYSLAGSYMKPMREKLETTVDHR